MYDPHYNMLIGTRYFLQQFKRYNQDLNKSVIAYNQGSYNTSKDGADYLAKFQKAYSRIAPQYQTASMNPLLIALMVSVAGGMIYYYVKK
jgi:soluble lytic murein transglycosylase-like protein